jgi:hypothetical protein
MNLTEKSHRVKRLIQRETAENSLLLTLFSFAGSIILTRAFLTFTGYPQIGNSELHIAHVLWGGLLLYAAALLPLMFANREIYTISAILAGIGVGLFMDEVGKFITQKNDYFYPAAAPIVYVAFLLSIVLFIRIRRVVRLQPRDQLARAIEDIWESLYYPLTLKEYKNLKERLETSTNSSLSPRHVELAQVLLTFVEAGAPTSVENADTPQKPPGLANRYAARFFTNDRLRVYLIFGLTLIGLLTLKNPLNIWLATFLPENITSWLASLSFGRQIDPSSAPLWFSIRLGLEVFVGILLLLSAGLFMAKRNKAGTTVGIVALLLSLTTVNLLLFYFEQFSTVITTAVQFLLLVGITIYRRRLAVKSE